MIRKGFAPRCIKTFFFLADRSPSRLVSYPPVLSTNATVSIYSVWSTHNLTQARTKVTSFLASILGERDCQGWDESCHNVSHHIDANRNDTRHSNTHYKNTRQNVTHYNNTRQNDTTHYNNTRRNDTHYNSTRYNDTCDNYSCPALYYSRVYKCTCFCIRFQSNKCHHYVLGRTNVSQP
jgi:hypothetical protein